VANQYPSPKKLQLRHCEGSVDHAETGIEGDSHSKHEQGWDPIVIGHPTRR